MGVTPWLRKRAVRGALAILVVASSSGGCAAARSIGGGLAEGALAQLQSDTTVHALIREVSDSVGSQLRVEFAGAVLDPAEETWGGMRGDLRKEIDGLRADLAVWVRSDLNEAVGQALSDNALILDQRLPGAADATATAFADAFARALTDRIGPAGDAVALGLLRALSSGVETELRPTLHALMREVRDSLQLRIQDVDRTVSESKSLSGLRAALLGAGIVTLLAGIVVVAGQRRRQDRALHALIDAIDASGDDGIQKSVRALAAEAGVHGWLSDRVAERRACRPEQGAEE